jgi:hypothetical protein
MLKEWCEKQETWTQLFECSWSSYFFSF